MAQYRDHDAEKIKERRWEDIRSEWMNYLPGHDSPWPIPEHEIYELQSLEQRLNNLGGPNKSDSTFEDEIEGLRSAALHESVINIHKAANVLRAAAREGEAGYRTWCRSSAYHAAFFGMRGVLGVLGVLLFRGRDRQSEYQVDLWAPRLQKKRPLGPTDSAFAIRIIRRRRAEHKELWGIFSRVLRVTTIDSAVWPLFDRDPLKMLDPGQFSHVRHEIHYRAGGWLFPDVNSLTVLDDFAALADEVAALKGLDTPEDTGFPVSLALYILSLGVALLQNLGQDIPDVALEAKRVEDWMNKSPWRKANAFVNG